MAQCTDSLQPISITPAAPMTAAATAAAPAAVTQAVVTTAATANSWWGRSGALFGPEVRASISNYLMVHASALLCLLCFI